MTTNTVPQKDGIAQTGIAQTGSSSTWHAPVIPYSPIDALNRRAAAVGSPSYGKATADADYNGHYVTVGWNEYKGYYIAQYTWAGRRVLCRGTFQSCLAPAISEYRREALGACVHVTARPEDPEALEEIAKYPELVEGDTDSMEWRTWQHDLAAQSVRDYANPGMLVIRFDWELMQAAEDAEGYKSLLANKYPTLYC